MEERLSRALAAYASLVDSYLWEKLRGAPEYIYKASTHLLRAGGKRVRPSITLAAASMLGGPVALSKAIPLAGAVEAIHNFSLIHDDIMDRDDFRRGVPTVHKVWGEAAAILAGDLLFAQAYAMVEDSLERGLTHSYAVDAYRTLAEASVKLSEGQAYDMMFEETWDVGVRDYLNMIYLKTGALLEASARLGAISAEAGRDVAHAMGEYGRLVGLAFQIRDDILGVFGDPEKTGKPVYNDLRRGKKTILLIYTAEKAGRGKVEQLLSEGKYEDLASLIRETGALAYAEELARGYMERALEILRGLREARGEAGLEGGMVRDPEAAGFLEDLARFVVEREK